MTDAILITDEMRNDKVYGGCIPKFGITYQSREYIVKYSDSSMTAFHEYIASKLIEFLHIPCQKVYLGIFEGRYAAMIEDFTSDGETSLHTFRALREMYSDTSLNESGYYFEDILSVINSKITMNEQDRSLARQHFWDMCICDVIIGNSDRHAGNWGYLYEQNTFRIAPLYDHERSFYPHIDKEINRFIDLDSRKDFLQAIVFQHSETKFKSRRYGRLSHEQLFSERGIFEELAQHTRMIIEKVSYEAIFKCMQGIVSELPLSDEYRRFFVELVTLRYMCIMQGIRFSKAFELIEGRLT